MSRFYGSLCICFQYVMLAMGPKTGIEAQTLPPLPYATARDIF